MEMDNAGNKKIVRKYKPYGTTAANKFIIKDSCNCSELSIKYSNFTTLGLFYSDSLQGQKRFFVFEDLISSNPLNFYVDIQREGNLSGFDIYYFLIVTDNNYQITEPELYMPHTYLV